MQTPPSDPFFLLDQCLSCRIAREVTRLTGFPITSLKDEWPDRNLNVNPPGDWEIIPHIGAKAGHRGVWITADWGAFRQHSQIILNNGISVLRLRGAESRNFPTLSRAQYAHILVTVIATVHRLIVASDSPLFFLASLDPGAGLPPALECLQSGLLEDTQQWEQIGLNDSG